MKQAHSKSVDHAGLPLEIPTFDNNNVLNVIPQGQAEELTLKDFCGLVEISGFGGFYEQECIKLAIATYRYLKSHGNMANKNLEQVHDDEGLQESLLKVSPDCTGAMIGASRARGYVIFRIGVENYKKIYNKKTPKSDANKLWHEVANRCFPPEDLRP